MISLGFKLAPFLILLCGYYMVLDKPPVSVFTEGLKRCPALIKSAERQSTKEKLLTSARGDRGRYYTVECWSGKRFRTYP